MAGFEDTRRVRPERRVLGDCRLEANAPEPERPHAATRIQPIALNRLKVVESGHSLRRSAADSALARFNENASSLPVRGVGRAIP